MYAHLHVILHTYQTLWALRDWQVAVTSSVAEYVAAKEVPPESRPVARLQGPKDRKKSWSDYLFDNSCKVWTDGQVSADPVGGNLLFESRSAAEQEKAKILCGNGSAGIHTIVLNHHLSDWVHDRS